MANVVITIEIPDTKYKNWSDFNEGGVDQVVSQLKTDFLESCEKLGIEGMKLEVIHKD